jgi:hypothetical protein
MPLLPMGPPQGGGLPMPPQDPGLGGLMPPPMDVAPAAAGAAALGPLAMQQQQALDQIKQQMAQEAMAVAMQAIAALPNPEAEAAQSEPSGLVPPGPGDASLDQGSY